MSDQEEKIKQLSKLCIELSLKVNVLEQILFNFLIESEVVSEEELNNKIEQYNQEVLSKVQDL